MGLGAISFIRSPSKMRDGMLRSVNRTTGPRGHRRFTLHFENPRAGMAHSLATDVRHC